MKRLILTFLLFTSCPALLAAVGDIESKLLSPSVLVGETTQMLVRIEGTDRAFIGTLPKTDDIQIKLLETTSPKRGRLRDTLFRFSVRPLREGVLTIPEIPFSILGSDQLSPSESIESVSPSSIDWDKKEVQEFEIEYGTRWVLGKTKLYAGESTPISLHIYLPRMAGPSKLAYPRDQSKGLAVTPLLPTEPYKPADEPIGQTLLKGRVYDVFVFSAKATAIAGGDLSLGPAMAPAIIKVRRTEGIQEQNFSLETALIIPSIDLTGLPFPSSPPQGYDGAIGVFDLSARVSAETLTPGAPVELELAVNGSGNFADLPPPRMSGSGDWKVASVRRLGGESSRNNEPARYQYLLTHPKTPDTLPTFELISFDPSSKSFKTTTTPQIPIVWSGKGTPGKVVPNLREIANAAKSDPFAPIPLAADSPVYRAEVTSPFWWSLPVAIAAFLPLCVLIGMGIRRRYRIIHPESLLIEKIRQVPLSLESDEYLHQLGNLLEENLPESNRPNEVEQLIRLRNEHCYTPEKSDFSISKAERKTWIKQLTRALSALALSVCIFSANGHAEVHTPSVDELVNKGSAKASEEDWAGAAVDFRQALATDPAHAEARKRLDLVHQNANTPLPEANFLKTSLGKFRRTTYLQAGFLALFAGLYAIGLSFATGRHLRPSVILAAACLISSALAFYIHQHYPYHHSERELSQRAVLKKISPLYQVPLASTEATYLPAATPVVITSYRSPWLHVETPELKRFWVKEDELLPMDKLSD